MEPGQSGDGGRTGSRRPPPESRAIGVEEFLRSAYQSGLISSTGGERLLAHFDAMKAQAAAASEPPAADTELAESRTAAALLIDRVSAAELRGEVPQQQADALKASLENACRGDDAAHIRGIMLAADGALKRAMQSPPVQAERRPDGAERERSPERAAPETAQRPAARPASTPRPTPARPPAASKPAPRTAPRPAAPTPTETPAERARAAATQSAEPRRQPVTPSRTPVAAAERPPGPFARLGTAMRSAWKTTTADFAANTLTYIGVLLAVIVIFVFFAFGYFGEVVSEPNLRPPFFVAVPLFFFGIAWVLRTRTGLPIAATAIGMLGALTVPVMLAALFRDWAPFPPDLHGSDRYWGYALVGVVSALIYFYLATRQRIYAYLIAPMLWAAAGSLGLYWKDGMSGPQLFTVLAAIIATFVVAARHQTGRVAELVAVPAVRVGVVAAPFVFVVSLVFAYDDAIRSGVAEPGIEDLAQPGAIAAALLAIVLGLASGMDFAWSGLGPRTRTALRVALRVLAYVTVGVALLLVLALEVTAGWIGVALLGYGVAVLAIDRLVRGTGEAALWIGRGTIVVGLVLAATEPIPTIMAWTPALLISAARAALPRIRSATSLFFPIPTISTWWLAELWVPAFVIAFLGVARAVEPAGVPWILVPATVVAAGTRWLPPFLRALRTYAIFPAVVFGIASFASTIWLHVAVEPFAYGEMGALLAGLAAATALIWIPWVWRAPFVVGLAIAGADLLIADVVEPDAAAAVLVQTLLFVTAGVVLLGASFVPRWQRWTYPNGLLGHLSLYGAVAVGAQTEGAALVALGALVLTHAAEAVAVQRGTSPFMAEAAVLAGSSRSLVEGAPATIAAVAALPLGILIGQQIPWLRAERARSAITFGVLALAYTAAAFWLRKPARWILVVLAYFASASAIVVAFPSRPASIVAVTAAALATFGLAAVVRRPGVSALSWVLSLIGIVLISAQLGVDQSNLYFPLFGTGILMVILGGTLNLLEGQRPGISNPWMVPPILVGVISIPIALAFAIAAGSWVWLLAGAAAATIAYLGWAAGTGGVTVAVAAYAGIAYANVLSFEVNIFVDDPVYWMPFAAVLVLASGLLPGRRGWRLLHDASPGALLAGLGAAAMATTLAFPAGSGAPVMALSSLLLGLVWILRRDDAWLHAGVIVLGSAAVVAGEGWLPGGLAVAAFIEMSLAELRSDKPEALVYRWVGAGFWVGAYASFVYWAGWDAGTVTIVTITIGAALSGIALAAYLLAPKHRITDMWLWPAAAVGQIALLGAGLYAGSTLTTTDTFLTWAALATIEALLVATYATVRIDQTSTWIATGLGTAALGFLAAAFPTEPINLIRVTGPAGAAILAAWALLTITHQPERLALWRWPSLALAQTALAITATLAAINLDPTPAAGTFAAITAWEALTFTTVATITTTKPEALVYRWVGAGFWVGAYASFVYWAGWDAGTVTIVTITIGAALSGIALAAYLLAPKHRITDMWLWPAAAVGQIALLGAGLYAGSTLTTTDTFLTWAALATVEALLVATYATVRIDQTSTWIATGLGTAALGFLAAAFPTEPINLIRVTGPAGAAILAAWALLTITHQPERLALWRWPSLALAQTALAITATLAAINLDPTPAAGTFAAITAWEALTFTTVATITTTKPEALVYRWVGAGFWVGAYASFVYWAGWDAGTVTIVTITIGAALSGIALAAYLLAPKHRITDMWLWPAAAVGQIALLGAGLYAGSTLTTTDTFLTWAALATVEALLVATYATVRIDQTSTWIATGLGTAALGFLAAAFPTEPINLIRVTGPAGAAILAAWALLTITHQPERLALWRWPSLALAQTALAITATLAAINLDPTPAAGTFAAITAWEALTFTTVATITTTKPEAAVAVGFALLSYDAALRWFELDATLIPSAWIALTLVALVGATFASHRVSSDRAGIWMWPLHGAGMSAGVMTLIAAAVYLSPTDARLLGAAVVAAAAIHLLANRSVFTPYMPVDSVAATAIVGAGALATTTLNADSSWTFVVLLAMALIGAVAPLIVDRLGEERIQPAIILVIGYGVIPVAAAAVFWGPLAVEVGYLLIVSGGALAGYGIVTHRLMALEAAAAIWLGSMLILLNDRFGLELHATIVLVAAVLLVVLEVERHRYLRKGQPQPEALRISEWIVMAVPLLIAAVESFESLAYVLVLGAEGLALLVWAGLTRVRRRAVMGLVAVTTAIVLGVTIPMFEEVRRGLTGGAWLVVGAIAAVVLIAAGSLIERQRIQIGKRLSQWGEILEDWE